MTALRRIAAMKLPGVEPGGADMAEPRFERAAPTDLLVDDAYQRNLSERSVGLIKKMVARWDWRSFKPPVVVRTPRGLEVVDGQHTAIAAATHPQVKSIPVMLIEAPEAATRAQAFLGHNRDRIAVTPTQLHVAAVAAGDPTALQIHRVCERAAIRVLKNPPGQGLFKPGDTLAISTIAAIIRRRGPSNAGRVLVIAAAAGLAPAGAPMLKALETLLFDDTYAIEVDPAALDQTLGALLESDVPALEAQARLAAAAKGLRIGSALAAILFAQLTGAPAPESEAPAAAETEPTPTAKPSSAKPKLFRACMSCGRKFYAEDGEIRCWRCNAPVRREVA